MIDCKVFPNLNEKTQKVEHKSDFAFTVLKTDIYNHQRVTELLPHIISQNTSINVFSTENARNTIKHELHAFSAKENPMKLPREWCNKISSDYLSLLGYATYWFDTF